VSGIVVNSKFERGSDVGCADSGVAERMLSLAKTRSMFR
jgi:hypothetical protein